MAPELDGLLFLAESPGIWISSWVHDCLSVRIAFSTNLLLCLSAADEMGLGKTLQTISLLSFLKFERNVQVSGASWCRDGWKC